MYTVRDCQGGGRAGVCASADLAEALSARGKRYPRMVRSIGSRRGSKMTRITRLTPHATVLPRLKAAAAALGLAAATVGARPAVAQAQPVTAGYDKGFFIKADNF